MAWPFDIGDKARNKRGLTSIILTPIISKRIDVLHTFTILAGMDIEYELRGIVFRWNVEKERANIRKHDGVTFRQAAQVFFDPFLMGEDASRRRCSRRNHWSGLRHACAVRRPHYF